MPSYKWDERLKIDVEVDPPPPSLFKGVGHDPTPKAGIKHYRRYYADELENIKDDNDRLLIESPFISEQLTRAEKPKQGGLLGGMFGGGDDEPMTVVNVGFFKGIVKCFNQELMQERK